MTLGAYLALFFCAACIVLMCVCARALDQRDALARQLDEARADYSAEIARSKRMALLAIDADHFFTDRSQDYDDAIRIIGSVADLRERLVS
jgi:hypothetical protein